MAMEDGRRNDATKTRKTATRTNIVQTNFIAPSDLQIICKATVKKVQTNNGRNKSIPNTSTLVKKDIPALTR